MHASRTLAPLLALAAIGLPHVAEAATVTFTFSFANSSGTSLPFGSAVNLPITPLAAGATVTNTLTGTITSLNGTTVTIMPFSQTFVSEALVNGVDSGIDVGTAQTSGPGAGPFTYGPAGGFFASGTFAAPITTLGSSLFVTLSPMSSATLTDTVTANSPTLTSTPEPSSVAAFAFTGLFAAGLTLRARKRKAHGTPTA